MAGTGVIRWDGIFINFLNIYIYIFCILFLEFKEHLRFGLRDKCRWKGDSGNIIKSYVYFDAGGTFDFKSSAGGNLMLICDLTKFV